MPVRTKATANSANEVKVAMQWRKVTGTPIYQPISRYYAKIGMGRLDK